MLLRLLKHEFLATKDMIRFLIFIPILAFCAGFVQRRWFLRQTQLIEGEYAGINTLQALSFLRVLLTVGFLGMIFALFFLTLARMIHRFRTNLLGDEGYLMFTLPVHVQDLVLSKLIVAWAWFIITASVSSLSIFVYLKLMASEGSLPITDEGVTGLQGYHNLTVLTIIFIIICFMEICLVFYMALSIGYSRSKNQSLLTLLILVAVIAVTMLLRYPGETSASFQNIQDSGTLKYLELLLYFGIVKSFVVAVVSYIVTVRMLKKHLNLE